MSHSERNHLNGTSNNLASTNDHIAAGLEMHDVGLLHEHKQICCRTVVIGPLPIKINSSKVYVLLAKRLASAISV